MHAARLSLYASPYIGLYARANDSLTIIGTNVTPHFEKACSALGNPVIKTMISGSHLVGLYLCMNSNGVIVPHTIMKKELDSLKQAGLTVYVSRETLNAFGNNIVANDKGALAHPEMSAQELKNISDVLGVPVEKYSLAGYPTMGSICCATNKGFICHNDAKEEDVAFISSVLGVKGSNGTVNMGSVFIGTGLVANSKGYLAGEKSSGFEMSRIDENLGFI